MSDADAVYYASLHSGVGLATGLSFERSTASAMKQQALAIGLDQVSWSPLPL
ncbi:MAG: hypothetical protein PW845_18455 [Pseudomonas sp.]|nr:hypothetical protein [Pseudomonas sp. PIA16]MDE1167296.1 hypothetical protein [Pseudomonas sp.]